MQNYIKRNRSSARNEADGMESGATAIEYGLIAAGISAVIIATVNAIGSTLNAKFDYISQQLK